MWVEPGSGSEMVTMAWLEVKPESYPGSPIALVLLALLIQAAALPIQLSGTRQFPGNADNMSGFSRNCLLRHYSCPSSDIFVTLHTFAPGRVD